MAKATDKKAAAAAETEALATQGTKEVATYDYGDDAVPIGQVARGYEGQTSEDTSMPWIVLLQPISPVVVESKVEGAKPGDWMHTLSNHLWKNPEGLSFVASFTRHEYLQFVPRKKGGGFVARYDIEDDIVAKAKAENKARNGDFGKYFVDSETTGKGEEGDELTETFTVYGVPCIGDDPVGMAVISFKGTMIKCYKHAMSQIRAHQDVINSEKRTPPLYAHLLTFTTTMEKKNGNTFFVPTYHPANGKVANSLLAPDDERFIMAKACSAMILSGKAKVNYDKVTQQEGSGAATGQSAF